MFHSPNEVLRQTVVEQNEDGIITNLFNLNQLRFETSHTLFLDGIISNQIISIKEHIQPLELENVKNSYNYIDLSSSVQLTDYRHNDKPLLLDFGSSSVESINKILKSSFLLLHPFSGIDIIAACTFHPLIILQQNPSIEVGNKCNLYLWKGINMVTKKIMDTLRIENITFL